MKTAIITGGTRGIGLGIAKCMARDGYNLILSYHTNHTSAASSQQMIERDYGVKVICCSGDIAVANTIEKLFVIVREQFDNELTAFVHNAGLYVGITTQSTDIQPKPTDDFEFIFDYYQKVYPRAFKRGLEMALTCKGLKYVVAVSSPGCNCNQCPRLQYEIPGQAKASMEFLVRLHARALAKKQITVNCVIPGYIKTEAWQNVIEKGVSSAETIDQAVKETPMERWAEPTEVGELVAFLCSPRATFITGVALPVDGGLHLQS